jgi:antirestriction protein
LGEHGEVIIELLAYHGDLEFAKSELENNYYGEHQSEQEFANDFFDDLYAHQVPKHLSFYIDYDAFSRDLFINDFYSVDTTTGVHVFAHH